MSQPIRAARQGELQPPYDCRVDAHDLGTAQETVETKRPTARQPLPRCDSHHAGKVADLVERAIVQHSLPPSLGCPAETSHIGTGENGDLRQVANGTKILSGALLEPSRQRDQDDDRRRANHHADGRHRHPRFHPPEVNPHQTQ